MAATVAVPIGVKKGDCHGGPPVALVVNGMIQFGWPVTDHDDWCGQFQLKVPDAE